MADDPVTRYAKRVVSGEVIAGPHVRNACQRHLDDLETGHKRGLSWSVSEVERVLGYFANVLTVEKEVQDEDGETVSEIVPFVLEESQEFIIGSLFGWKNKNGHRRFRRAYVEIGKGNGKALALDTPIPTPDGWSTMGDLRVGDRVFDESGQPCSVTACTDVMHDRPCYRVTFSDGAEIVADADHLWLTSALRTGGKKGPKPASESRKGQPAIRTTREIAETLVMPPSKAAAAPKWNHRVEVAGALDLPAVDLPVPPYTLGAWLGDGDSDCGRITSAFVDGEVIERIKADGFCVTQQRRHSDTTGRYGIGGLAAHLREAGVLGDKHIPAKYMRASESQRRDLLCGLMDTDGFICHRGQAELTLCNERLALDAVDLIRTLGYKPTITESDAKLQGRVVGRRWRVLFHPCERPAFHLRRKLKRQPSLPKTRRLSKGRMIVGCEPIESVPVKCIEVDSPSHLYLAGEHLVPTHNSPMAAGIGHYMMTATRKLRAEVYSAATDKDQAAILFRDAVEMWRRSPALHSRLTPSGQNPVWQLTMLQTASFFKPISSEKKGKSGIRPYCALIDEVHEHPDNSVIEMLRAGTKGNQQALIFEITNSGHDLVSVCGQEHEYSCQVASGEKKNDSWFSYVCALDDDDDPFEDESCWIKANPLLGVSIHPEFIREQVEEARGMPSKEGLVRRLHFCQWTEGEEGWISRDAWMQIEHDLKIEDYVGEPCYCGLDLSYTKDLSAAALVFQPKPKQFDAFVFFWKPKDGLQNAVKEDRRPYDLWAKNGYLELTQGKVIKLKPIGQKLADFQDRFDLQAVVYDNYRHRELVDDLTDLGIDLPMSEHPQGFRRTKGNPLWMPTSVQTLENAITEGRLRVCFNPLLRWNAASAVIREDPAGTDNRIFDKRKSRARIDGIVALAMGVGAADTRQVPVFPVSIEDIVEDLSEEEPRH